MFARPTCHFVGFVLRQLNFKFIMFHTKSYRRQACGLSGCLISYGSLSMKHISLTGMDILMYHAIKYYHLMPYRKLEFSITLKVLQLNYSISVLTHSSCRAFRIAGMLVADGGRGFTKGEAKIQININICSQTNNYT